MAKFVVTAGPTREYLDGVRYLANASTGRMGYAIAAAAAGRGHEVCLVSGPTELEPPAGVELVRVVSAREMHAAALAAFEHADVAFGVAAVADFRPAECVAGKPAKGEARHMLELVENPDVIGALGAIKGDRFVAGFALEALPHEAALEKARGKLASKHLDLCVLNSLEAMGATDNSVTLVWADGSVESVPPDSKDALGALLVDRVIARVSASGGKSW